MTAPKKTAAKKTAAKKSPAEKTAAKKSPAEKTAAKKEPAEKAAVAKPAAGKAAAEKAPSEKTAAKKTAAGKAARKTPAGKAARKTPSGFTDAERSAMKERAVEVKAARRGGDRAAEDAAAALAKIAEMEQPDRAVAERIHAIITSVAPVLAPTTWYGMPAYAKGGKVVCFFQPAKKFRARYAILGFNDSANLDDGTMWPTAYAVTDLSDADAKRIEELITRAVS